MNEYKTIKEIADVWGVSVRWVQTLCLNGQIEGAVKFGNVWAIPEDAQKPADKRLKNGSYVGWRKK